MVCATCYVIRQPVNFSPFAAVFDARTILEPEDALTGGSPPRGYGAQRRFSSRPDWSVSTWPSAKPTTI
jgi:hypothetical protein